MQKQQRPTWSFNGPQVSPWSFNLPENPPGATEKKRNGCWNTTKQGLHLLLQRLWHRVKECIPTADICLEKVTVEDVEGNREEKKRCKRMLPPAEEIREKMWRWSLCLKFSLFCFCTFIGVIAVCAVPNPWPDAEEFTRCEVVRPNSLLREPMNAMSNLGYIWVGSYMLLCGIWDRIYYWKILRVYNLENLSTGPDESPRVYCLADFPAISFCLAIMVGLTSMWHHACTAACPMSVFYDLYSICVAISCIVQTVVFALVFVLRLVKPGPDDNRQKVILNVAYILLFLVLSGLWIDYRSLVADGIGGESNMGFILVGLFGWTMISLGTIALTAKKNSITPSYPRSMLGLMVFFLATGVAAWLPEDVFASCPVSGDSIFQLHAYWHVALSLAYLFLFLFFRSLSNKTVELQGGIWSHIFLERWNPPWDEDEEEEEDADDLGFRESIGFQDNGWI